MNPIDITNLGGNMPIQFGSVDFGGVQDGVVPEKDILSVSEAPQPLAFDGIAGVPDAALTRDDDLGRRVSAAFNLPAPPAPQFV